MISRGRDQGWGGGVGGGGYLNPISEPIGHEGRPDQHAKSVTILHLWATYMGTLAKEAYGVGQVFMGCTKQKRNGPAISKFLIHTVSWIVTIKYSSHI